MTVKCIKNYYDLKLKKDIKVGDELTVNEDRGNILLQAKVVELATTPEVVTEAKPKGKRSSKCHE